MLEAVDGRRLDPVDEVVVVTGFRPDLSFLSEVRLDLDPVLQAPRALAPLIDPNVHSCGTVYPHGAVELAQPEPGVFLVGMKSYGRAPTFLALTGYEQVRSIAAAIAGDREAAERVELVLPETGVCSGGGLVDETDTAEATAAPSSGGCCGPTELVAVTAPALVAAGGTARAERVVGGMQSARVMSTGPATLSEFGLRRVLAVLCVTEIVSWGVLYYAFPVLAPAHRRGHRLVDRRDHRRVLHRAGRCRRWSGSGRGGCWTGSVRAW